MSETGRLVAIRHRVKRTAEGEARPTQVTILLSSGVATRLELEDDEAELKFAFGVYESKKKTHGLCAGDTVLMALGGSGDNLAYALARRGEEVDASVWRIPSYRLMDARGTARDSAKEDDTELLCQIWCDHPEWFYQVRQRDRALIRVRELYRARMDTMKARIAAGQILRQVTIGAVFTCSTGLYPEGGIEQAYELAKTQDPSYLALEALEKQRIKEMTKALEALDVYTEVFGVVKGCGPAIAARLISGIQDIRRFETDAKLKAFCGVHVLADGRFARKRSGERCNWSPDCRQALYLLADQFEKSPDSFWGRRFRANKVLLRQKHPEAIEVESKKRYNDGHIRQMAKWRTVTQFVRWLWMAWTALERDGHYKLPTA